MRFINTILQFITEKIYVIWKNNKYKVASFFSLDVNGAFDRVLYTKFIYNLRKKKISKNLLNWTQSFLSDKLIKLCINNFILSKSNILINIL
jgi:hypothetical protein